MFLRSSGGLDVDAHRFTQNVPRAVYVPFGDVAAFDIDTCVRFQTAEVFIARAAPTTRFRRVVFFLHDHLARRSFSSINKSRSKSAMRPNRRPPFRRTADGVRRGRASGVRVVAHRDSAE